MKRLLCFIGIHKYRLHYMVGLSGYYKCKRCKKTKYRWQYYDYEHYK
jgi:hypothetical protein